VNPFLQILSPELMTSPEVDLNNTVFPDQLNKLTPPVDFAAMLGSLAVSGEVKPELLPDEFKTIATNFNQFADDLTGKEIFQKTVQAPQATINFKNDNQVLLPINDNINLIFDIVSNKAGNRSAGIIGAIPEPENMVLPAESKKIAESILFRSNVLPKNISAATPATFPTQMLDDVNIKEIEIAETAEKPAFFMSDKNLTGKVATARTIAVSPEPTVPSVMSNTNSEMGGSGDQSLLDKNLFKPQLELTGANKISSGEISVTNFSDIIKTERVVGKNEIQQIKFIMPQDFGQESVKEHKTITIKMEPQSLGTIRLTLSTHVNNLTGRMIVDNPAALMALESNLDNLYHELSEKGIKLDSLQLSLGGSQTGDFTGSGLKSDFDQIFGSGRSLNGQPYNDENSSAIPDGLSDQAASGTYITAGGVNWLA